MTMYQIRLIFYFSFLLASLSVFLFVFVCILVNMLYRYFRKDVVKHDNDLHSSDRVSSGL